MRIIVTGAAGFIGSHICDELLKQGHLVMGIDDLSTGSLENVLPGVEFREVDCRRVSKIEPVFWAFKPEVIYHLAANARESASFYQPMSVVSRNVGAYTNVLTTGIKYGLKRMILFSSIAVYGHQPAPFKEDMLPKPADVYGLSKSYMEQLTIMMSTVHDFEYVIFRPHNVFGERQALDDPYRNVIAIWMNNIMRGEPITIYGDGTQRRAFSYIKNSLPAYVSALEKGTNNIFNIGSERDISVNDLAVIVLKEMGAPEDYPVNYLPLRAGEVKQAFSISSKARLNLHFDDKTYATAQGLRRMAKWAREKGPQEWKVTDKLELINETTPKNWV